MYRLLVHKARHFLLFVCHAPEWEKSKSHPKQVFSHYKWNCTASHIILSTWMVLFMFWPTFQQVNYRNWTLTLARRQCRCASNFSQLYRKLWNWHTNRRLTAERFSYNIKVWQLMVKSCGTDISHSFYPDSLFIHHIIYIHPIWKKIKSKNNYLQVLARARPIRINTDVERVLCVGPWDDFL